jgi:hypothetical protein
MPRGCVLQTLKNPSPHRAPRYRRRAQKRRYVRCIFMRALENAKSIGEDFYLLSKIVVESNTFSYPT